MFFFDNDLMIDDKFPIIIQMVVDSIHHDIVGYYDYEDGEYNIFAVKDENGKFCLEARFPESNTLIIIEDGQWYFA